MSNSSAGDFDTLKNQLLNNIILWIGITASVGVALSLSRIFVIGWKPLMGIHIMVLVSLWCLWFGRRLLSYRTRILGILAQVWIASSAGLIQLGPLGLGGALVVSFSFIAVLFLGDRLAWWLLAGNTFSLILIGIAASRHWLEFDVDYQIYAHHPIVWMHTVWTFSAYSFIFALFCSRLTGWLVEREQLIRRERDLRQSYLDTAQSIMVSLDQTGRITMINRKGIEVLGRKESELLGRNWYECAPPQPLGMETFYPRFLAVMSGTEPAVNKAESLVACHNGEERLIAWENAYLTDGHGQLTGMLSMGMDITERKQIEIALVQSEERFRLAFSNANTGMCLVDLQGNLLQVNDKMSAIFGYSKQELESMAVNDLALPEDTRLSMEFIQEAVQGKRDSATFEKQYRHRLGEIIYAQVSSSLVRDPGGQPQYFISQVHDITERKQTEEALRESEKQFKALADTSPLAIFVSTDIKQRYEYINPTAVRLFGYTQEEIQSVEQWWPLAYPDETYRRQIMGEWQRKVEHAIETQSEIEPMEVVVTCKDGSHKIIQWGYKAIGKQNWAFGLDLTDRKRAEEEIKQLAFYDALTHLPNRRLLLEHLQQALVNCIRSKLYGALLFIDLDNFKTLNDTLGHDMGDLLLQEVASRLASCVRESDTVARLGGDEFVVMLLGLDASPEKAAAESLNIGMKITDRLNQKYQLKGYEHYCSASIGINLFDEHCSSPNDILKQADIALYQAKTAGRNTLRFFDPEMQSYILTRAALSNDLHLALAKNQFKIFCQIEVGRNQKISGVEVLLRWDHHKQGMISPHEFIPLAEETGLIHPIGQWVLEAACALLKSWEKSSEWGHLYLSVNISVRQFHQPNFVSGVLDIVQNTGIDPGRLMLELTESVVLANLNDAAAKMKALKDIGLRFSIDDFGTGYSSLAYLTRLPFDQLKIDRSFVQNIGVNASDAVIIKAIIAMANELGISVVAEGVETEAQHEFLKQQGCPIFQGYLFGKPVRVLEFVENLKFNPTAADS